MANPWEKYQQPITTSPASNVGNETPGSTPWEKYQQPITTSMEEPTDGSAPETDQTVLGSIARGAGAGVVDIAQGIAELGAAGIDLAADTDYSEATTRAFEGVKESLGLVPERTAGKVAEALVNYGSLAIPIAGWLGAASKAGKLVQAGKTVPAAATAFQRTARAFGATRTGQALTGSRAALAGTTAIGTGLADVLVAPSTGETLADSWDALPDFLRTEDTEGLTGRDLAAARLANKFRIGLEGAGIGLGFEAALPVVGLAAKSAAYVPGVPQAARALSAGIDALGSKVGEVGFVRKYLTPNGFTPREIFDITSTAQNIAEAEQQAASKILSKYDTAMKKAVSAQRLMGRGKKALQKGYQDTTDLLTGALSPQAFKKEYGEKALNAAQEMRLAIDEVSTRFEQSVLSAPNLSNQQKNDLLQQFQNNQGTYLRRIYELHLQPEKFLSKDIRALPEYQGALNQVAAYIQRRNPQLLSADAAMQAEQTISKIFNDDLVNSGMTPETSLRLRARAIKTGFEQNLGRAPLFKLASGMLTDRKDLLDNAPLLREMMGEITNPRELFLRTVDDMSKTMASQKLYNQLGANMVTYPQAVAKLNAGGNPFVIDGTTVGDDIAKHLTEHGYVKLGSLDPKNAFGGQFGVLTGHWVPNEIYTSLTVPMRAHSGVQDALAVALQAKGVSQMAKTVLNPLSQVRNFLSNTFMVGANANLGRGMGLFESADVLLSNALDSPEQYKFLRAMAEEGAIGQNIQLNELTRLMKERTAGGVSAALQKGGDWLRSSKLGAPVRFMEKTYQLGDDYWKVVGALGEKAKYSGAFRKAGLDFENLPGAVQQSLVNSGLANRTSSIAGTDFADLLAIDTVRATMPTYSMVPEAIKQLRRIPVIGNFMSFPAEIIRTSSNIVTRGIKELGFKATNDIINAMPGTTLAAKQAAAKQLERQIRGIGAQRLSSYVAMATVAPTAMRESAHTVLGITQSQEENLARSAPPWTLGNTLMYISAPDKNGNAEYVDLSYMLPYEFALAPARAALQTYSQRGEVSQNEAANIGAGLWEGLKKFVEPFASESMMAERINDVTIRNGRTAEGAVIYRSAEDTGDKIGRSLMHIVGAFIPGIAENFVTVKGGQFEPGRITRAATGEFSAAGDPYYMAEELGTLLTGLRPMRLNTARSLSYAGSEYSDLRTSASGIFTSVADDNDVTKEEVVDAFIRANEARRRQAANLYAKIQAARDAGMSDQRIRQSFENTGVSGRELSFIMQNRYLPLRPSRDIIREVLREASGGTADVAAENRILKRLPVQELNNIANGLLNQPLTGVEEAPAAEYPSPEPVSPAGRYALPGPIGAAPAPAMESPASPLTAPAPAPSPSGQPNASLRTNPIVLGYDRATQALSEYLSGRQ